MRAAQKFEEAGEYGLLAGAVLELARQSSPTSDDRPGRKPHAGASGVP
jgi:hypothetical protein